MNTLMDTTTGSESGLFGAKVIDTNIKEMLENLPKIDEIKKEIKK
jgi:hypothetical protein